MNTFSEANASGTEALKKLWDDLWHKTPAALTPSVQNFSSEDFLYFPLVGLPNTPLPDTDPKKADLSLTLDKLSLPSHHARILVVDGALQEKESQLDPSISLTPLPDYPPASQKAIQNLYTDRFKIWSLASRKNVLKISLKGAQPTPLHLVLSHTQGASQSAPQILVECESGGNFTLHLHLLALPGAQTPLSMFLPYVLVDLPPKTSLNLVQVVQNHGSTAIFSYIEAAQRADSHCHIHLATQNGNKTRLSVGSLLSAPGAQISLDGVALSDQKSQIEIFTRVFHQSPKTRSDQFFKAMARHGAQFSFDGDVIISPHARGVEAHQLSKNLLLDKGSQIFARPSLHVEHNDLICTHGTTIGGLSEAEQFYLQSRGISEPLAQELLLRSFLGEILERFPHPQDLGETLASFFQKTPTQEML